jgi:hypothetical protein
MLLLLMMAVAVMTIALLGVARNYRRMIVRDREVEMVHRGEQYERAVRRFYHKVGSYPTSIEQLENTNNVRYLRKKYKDPMAADGLWKPVHLTDIKLKPGGGVTAANTNTGLNQSPASATAVAGAAVAGAAAAGAQGAAASTGISDQTAQGPNASSGAAAGGASGGTDSSGGASTTGSTTGNTAGNATGSASGNNGPTTSGAVLGGGPILGVVSKSKDEGIHSYGGKTKYSEWFFIYDPSQDKGQQMVGPYNPNMTVGLGGGGTQNPATPGNAATPGAATPAGASTPAPATTP